MCGGLLSRCHVRPPGVNATYPTYGKVSGVSVPVSVSVSIPTFLCFPVAQINVVLGSTLCTAVAQQNMH